MKQNGGGDPIREQIAYYEGRASEYDSTSKDVGHPTDEHRRAFESALEAFAPKGSVLELACGTGNWTRRLVKYTSTLTAIDASGSMLERARAKVDDACVHWEQADVFEWRPSVRYDVVFFSFWLSHVPTSRFRAFWELLDVCLEPDGRVFFIDEAGHKEWEEEFLGDELVRRRLEDGSEHRVIKRFWEPQELETKLQELGWSVTVTRTGPFYWGQGGRRR